MGKLGLVLCGGVAKGAYEAGVLKALAERGVYPDAIVGISAGAINGAFAAQMIASGRFTSETVENDLIHHWRESVTAENLFHGYNRLDGDELERRNLRTLFKRIGVDPLKRQYRPRIGFDSLFAFEQMIRGDFASIISHHFIRQMVEEYIHLPHHIKRPVKLSIVATDLLGSTSLSDDLELATHYSHYEDFVWDDSLTEEGWESFFTRINRWIEASSSFPFLFPPTRDEETGRMFFDGGLMDNAPIGRAIKMDPEIDTVIVVSGSTIVDRPPREPDNIYGILGRVFSLLAGRFVIQNFRKVLQQNQQIARLNGLLQHGRSGQVLRNSSNEALILAAGYKDFDNFLSRRIVRLVPVFPRPSLPGDVLDGFFDAELRAGYVEQGYLDAIDALSRDPIVSLDQGTAASSLESSVPSDGIPPEALLFMPEFDITPILDS